MFAGKFVFQFLVRNDAAELSVHEEHAAWL